MRKLLLLPSLSGLVAMGLVFASSLSVSNLSAQSLVHDRIESSASRSVRSTLAHTLPARALKANDLGPVPASTALPSLTLRFSLSAAQNQALTTLEAAQQNPSSPLYHQWLTPEQYGAQFGLSDGDLAQVTSWLSAQGFTNIQVARSRTLVSFSGSAAQAEAAFATSIHSLQSDGETHIGSLTEPSIPTAFASVVGGITGLDDFRLRPRIHTRTVPAPNPQFTSSISGSTFIAPGDFYTIYDTNPLLNASINGTGITIAVMGQTDIALSDVAAFRSASGLAANVPTIKLYGADPGTTTADLPEASLDVEWSGAVAPAATILYVNSTNVISGSLTQAITNNLAPIVTISYGDCETGFGSSNLATYNQLFRQATVQGQTIIGPAGDTGATDCDYGNTNGYAQGGLAVDFPASSPYVTGLGGSEFNEAGGTYFSTTNGTYQGSALSYIPEMVWNDDAAGGGLAAGGGGSSAFFTKPAFQVGTGVPADLSRDVPDLSLNASPDHDGYLYCSGGFCTNGFRNSTSNLDVVGGTSVSTPAFAGIMALLEQKIKSRVGNANPIIYGLANSTYYSTVFHDITVGSNASPCVTGSTNCPVGGSIGYSATAGYDLASGWGSVDAYQLVNDWLLVTPAGSSSAQGFNTVAVNVSPTSTTLTAGTADTLNVSVVSSTSGLTTTPTGTVQLVVDGTITGTPVTLANGAATLTVATTGFASGGHTITVVYSGDTNYSGAKGTFTLDVVSSVIADFSLTPSITSLSVAAGTTSSGVTYTLTPANGFTGAITLSAIETTNTLTGTYAFTVDPVTITSTTPVTTVFTLQAFQAALKSGNGNLRFTPNTASNSWPAQPGKASPWALGGSGIAVAGLCLIVLPRRRRRWGALLAALLTITMLGASGCGDNSSAANINSPTGQFQLIITAANATGTISHNATLNLTIH